MCHIVSLARDNTCNSCHSQKACHFTQSLCSMTPSFDNIKQCLANPPNCHIVAKYVQIKKGRGAHFHIGQEFSWRTCVRWKQPVVVVAARHGTALATSHDEIRNFKAGSSKKSAPSQLSKTTTPSPGVVCKRVCK